MFEHKGIKSELKFNQVTKEHLIKTIDYLFEKYNIGTINCEILLSNNNRPSQLFFKIYLAPINGNLSDHQKIIYQFSHELSHSIQDYQQRGLPIKCKFVDGVLKQEDFPAHSIQETEAVANSVDVIENVLKYEGYNARQRDYPEYYDYDEAFRLVDSGELNNLRKKYSNTVE